MRKPLIYIVLALVLSTSAALAQDIPTPPSTRAGAWMCPCPGGPVPLGSASSCNAVCFGAPSHPAYTPRSRSQPIERRNAPVDRATPLISDGDDAVFRNDWENAIRYYEEALQYRPGDPEIEAKLRRAREHAQREYKDYQAWRHKLYDKDNAKKLQTFLKQTKDKIAAKQNQSTSSNLMKAQAKQAAPVRYPVFKTPVHPHDPALRVMHRMQPRVRVVDREIRQAQQALHRLIAANAENERARTYWMQQSEIATADAEDLGIYLLFDLIDARAAEHAKPSSAAAGNEFEQFLTRCDGGASGKCHEAFQTLAGTHDDLTPLRRGIGLARKTMDIQKKVQDFNKNHTQSALEAFWDMISQFQIVEDLSGPSADLLNSSYAIYRQAVSVQQLALLRKNDEKTYIAAGKLASLIRKLEAQKRKE